MDSNRHAPRLALCGSIGAWRNCRLISPTSIRENIRLTVQPFDAPGAAEVETILGHIDCDEMLLYSTDFPHWQFDGRAAIPPGIPAALVRKLALDNPLATYPRLKETPS